MKILPLCSAAGQKMRIVFMGTPRAAVPSFERLLDDGHDVAAVYTQPDRPSGRGNKIIFSPVKEFALEHALPVLQPTKIRTTEALTELLSFKADVLVVVAYGRILPESFLKAFPLGALNVHFSLLPKYRGAAPVTWAIVNGDAETGVTTMRMDAGLDTGPILLQQSVMIGEKETAIELMDRLAIVGAELLSATMATLEKIEPEVQDHVNATLAPIMQREDGLIDWNLNATAISTRVRGFQPFPTSFTFIRGSKLTVWKAFPTDKVVGGSRKAGEVLLAKGDDLLISCGDGSVLGIEEIQPEGKRRMQTRDFLNGVKLNAGEGLGG